MSGGAWVCPLRYRSWEIAILTWLPSCVCCPPRLNRWTRCRLDPDLVGGSGVDIVSFMLLSVVVCLCISKVGVSSLSVTGFLCSLFLSVVEMSRRFDFCWALVVFGFSSSAATVGSIVAVLSRWGVCLFSRSGSLSTLSGGICIVGLCECGSFVLFTLYIVLFVW